MCLIFRDGARILWRMVLVSLPLFTDICSFIPSSLPTHFVLVLWVMLTKIIRGLADPVVGGWWHKCENHIH